MRINYEYTKAERGGFGVLGKGIQNALLQAGHELVETKPDIVFRYGVADVLNAAREKFPKEKLVYYTVWESSKYPPNWGEVIKKNRVDLLLTATKFTQSSLKKLGLKAEVWHHGIDSRWQFKERRHDNVFTFVHYNAYEWRKGWEILLKAFIEEFNVGEPVKLIMKARERNDANWIISPQQQGGIDHPLIEEVIGHISDEEMVELMERADCGVFPVKGEGWFLPSMECAAQGIPVILPKQMGLVEQWVNGGYLDIDVGWINAEPRYPGYMMLPRWKDLRRKMRWMFNNQEKARIMGKVASKEVHRRFNWPKIINDFENYINLLLK